MTAQIPDEVEYRAGRYAVTAVDGTGLFDPARHGLEPQAMSTACWRGFICAYRVEQGVLRLSHLEIALDPVEGEAPLELFGRAGYRLPESGDVAHPEAWHYDPDAPVGFTGRLLLGDGDAAGPYLNMGFLPAWYYEDIRELTFTAGRLTAESDLSASVARLRETLAEGGAQPAPGESTREWVTRTFSLSFDYSLPNRE